MYSRHYSNTWRLTCLRTSGFNLLLVAQEIQAWVDFLSWLLLQLFIILSSAMPMLCLCLDLWWYRVPWVLGHRTGLGAPRWECPCLHLRKGSISLFSPSSSQINPTWHVGARMALGSPTLAGKGTFPGYGGCPGF